MNDPAVLAVAALVVVLLWLIATAGSDASEGPVQEWVWFRETPAGHRCMLRLASWADGWWEMTVEDSAGEVAGSVRVHDQDPGFAPDADGFWGGIEAVLAGEFDQAQVVRRVE